MFSGSYSRLGNAIANRSRLYVAFFAVVINIGSYSRSRYELENKCVIHSGCVVVVWSLVELFVEFDCCLRTAMSLTPWWYLKIPVMYARGLL